MKLLFNFIAVIGIGAIIVFMIVGGNDRTKKSVKKYQSTIKEQNYAAHALGGIDGYSYTNSIEAAENSYENGFRIFEVDISVTSDHELVCSHGWAEKDYKKRLGIPYNADSPVMSLEQFMSIKIQKKYTPLSFSDFVEFLKKHTDVYVMLDIGNRSYDETHEIYTKIVEYCNGDKRILQRLITGGHTPDMIRAVKDVYDFKLINLYWAGDEVRPKEIYTKEDFVKYCMENGITSLSVSTKNADSEWAEYIRKFLIIYVFTEDNEENAKKLLEYCDIVGTNFINN